MPTNRPDGLDECIEQLSSQYGIAGNRSFSALGRPAIASKGRIVPRQLRDTERTEPNGSSPQHHRVVFRASTNRSVIVRVLCILSMALVCMLGVVQAVHTHPENSTASHHSCSICSTAHAGLSTQTIAAAPVLTAAALATPARELAKTFRPSTVHFIRPPPAA